MTRLGIVAAWIVATGLATVLAWQVVGAADEQVSNGPRTPLIATTTGAASEVATGATEPRGVTGSTAGTSTVATTAPAGSTPTSGPTPTTAPNTEGTAPPASSTTSTTVPGTSTTTGVPNVAATTAVTDGGSVSVTGVEPSVELVAVVASLGWSYEVTANDGERVEVRFESLAGDRIRIRCEWVGGRLVAAIDE